MKVKIKMFTKRRYFFLLTTLVIFFALYQQVHAQVDQIYIPNITPYFIKRIPYETVSSGAIIGKGGKKTDTIGNSQFNIAAIAPILGGVLSVIGGSVFTWIQLGKKKKLFKSYMKQITETELAYTTSPEKKGKKEKARKIFTENLQKILQEAELAAADKKIDEDQRTVIAHTIQRKVEEFVKT